VRHVARTGDKRIAYGILVWKSTRMGTLQDLTVENRFLILLFCNMRILFCNMWVCVDF